MTCAFCQNAACGRSFSPKLGSTSAPCHAQPAQSRTSVRSFAERGPRLASHASEPVRCPALSDGDSGCGDGGGDLDILGPIDGKDVRPGGFFAVDAYKVDSAAAGAEGLHKGGIVDGGGLRSVEEVEFAADDVAGFLGAAPFGVVAGKDADSNIDVRVEQ